MNVEKNVEKIKCEEYKKRDKIKESNPIKSDQNLGAMCVFLSRKIPSTRPLTLLFSCSGFLCVISSLFIRVKYGTHNTLAFRVIQLHIRFDRYTRFKQARTQMSTHII